MSFYLPRAFKWADKNEIFKDLDVEAVRSKKRETSPTGRVDLDNKYGQLRGANLSAVLMAFGDLWSAMPIELCHQVIDKLYGRRNFGAIYCLRSTCKRARFIVDKWLKAHMLCSVCGLYLANYLNSDGKSRAAVEKPHPYMLHPHNRGYPYSDIGLDPKYLAGMLVEFDDFTSNKSRYPTAVELGYVHLCCLEKLKESLVPMSYMLTRYLYFTRTRRPGLFYPSISLIEPQNLDGIRLGGRLHHENLHCYKCSSRIERFTTEKQWKAVRLQPEYHYRPHSLRREFTMHARKWGFSDSFHDISSSKLTLMWNWNLREFDKLTDGTRLATTKIDVLIISAWLCVNCCKKPEKLHFTRLIRSHLDACKEEHGWRQSRLVEKLPLRLTDTMFCKQKNQFHMYALTNWEWT